MPLSININYLEILEITRRLIFWFIDSLKGKKIASQYNDIKKELNNLQKTTNEKVNFILDHATRTTAFYKDYSGLKLDSFPVINKNLIKSKQTAFLSNSFSEKDRISVVTSGSTGTPFQVFIDRQKKNRNLADTLYFSELGGYQLGNKLFYLKIWAKEKLKSKFHYLSQNIVTYDVIKLSDERVKLFLDTLIKYKGNVSFLGYTSAWETICKYLDKNQASQHIKKINSIITMSESLDPYTKERMEFYFGTIPLSRYSNLENGIIAQQIKGSGAKYLINTASYLLEILNIDNDLPAPDGTLGRIVVTDLFNYAMPMIRYDTGDFGILSKEIDKFGNRFLDKVEGRKLDLLYDVDGQIVSSYIMYKNMWKYTEIDQYQIIQTGLGQYTIIISIYGNKIFNREDQLKYEFLMYLGQTAEIKIEYVYEIPLLDSGKRRKVVNLYLQNLKK